MAGGAPPMPLRPVAAIDAYPSSACLCVDALSFSSVGGRGRVGDKGMKKVSSARRHVSCSLDLSSSFLGSSRACGRPLVRAVRRRCKRKGLVVVDELGGNYEEGFEDVHGQIINFFTYKAVRTVLNQLYEMNPPSYRWFYNFVGANQPMEGARFLRALGKEKQELAERVMITRLHLYGKWIKKCDHAKMYQKISDENLQLMRERLLETVIWPTDDTNADTVG